MFEITCDLSQLIRFLRPVDTGIKQFEPLRFTIESRSDVVVQNVNLLFYRETSRRFFCNLS
jgi:hypothetical protein